MLQLDKKLYEPAITKEQKKEFDEDWKTISDEMGNHYFPLHELEMPHLIKNEQGIVIGTVTFVLKNPHFSIVDDFFDFTDFLPPNAKPIEIGKLSIKKEHRNQNQEDLPNIIKCIFDVVREQNATHIVGTINSGLYAKLRRAYRMPIQNLATVAHLPKCDVLAILTDVEEMFTKGNDKMKALL